MAVNYSGIDYSKWKEFQNTPLVTYKPVTTTNSQASNKYDTNDSVQISGETCTDGKDDGKIGFGSALWNTIKGVGKTAVNMVKGCFTGKDGKFSLGKTLLTAATAAVCVAFPAVGLVACGIGAVTGAVQIGKGVYNAATADTDAEAKLAWQDVGGGALTTGLSVAGAEASYNAVMKTSTAGINGGSATSELGKDASLMSKAKALGHDMVSSTTNRAKSIGAAAKSTAEALQYKNAQNKAAKIDTKSALTDEEVSVLKEAEAREAFLSDDAKTIANKMDNVSSTVENKADVVKNAVKDAVKDPKTTAQNLYNKVKSSVTKENISALGSKLKGAPKAIAQKIAEGKTSLDELVSQYGYDNVIEVLEIMGSIES